jgi:hypothetical protein
MRLHNYYVSVENIMRCTVDRTPDRTDVEHTLMEEPEFAERARKSEQTETLLNEFEDFIDTDPSPEQSFVYELEGDIGVEGWLAEITYTVEISEDAPFEAGGEGRDTAVVSYFEPEHPGKPVEAQAYLIKEHDTQIQEPGESLNPLYVEVELEEQGQGTRTTVYQSDNTFLSSTFSALQNSP